MSHHQFRQYDVVEIAKLSRAASDYDGWGLNKRPPAPGDRGTVVDILGAPKIDTRYVVECVEPDGNTVWLGDFLPEELAPVEARKV